MKKMKSIFKQVLFFLCILLVLGYVNANSVEHPHQRLRVAPLKDFRNDLTEGTGAKDVSNTHSTSTSTDPKIGVNSRVSITTVALFTLAMASASGFGAIPFFFVELDPQWEGLSNGMAAGVMLAASFDLIQEGQQYGHGNWVVFGLLSGALFIALCKKVTSPIFLCLFIHYLNCWMHYNLLAPGHFALVIVVLLVSLPSLLVLVLLLHEFMALFVNVYLLRCCGTLLRESMILL